MLHLHAFATPLGGAAPLPDLATESLVLWLDGRDVTYGVSTTWDSRASLGTSGGVVMGAYSSGDPITIAPSAAPSGNPIRAFNPTVGLLTGGLVNSTDATLLGLSGEATFVATGKFEGSVTSTFGNNHNGAIVSAYNLQYFIGIDAAGTVYGGGVGTGIAGAAGSVAAPTTLTAGDYFVAILQLSSTSGMRIKVNGGAWSSWSGNPWAAVGASDCYMGFDPTYGDAASLKLGQFWIANFQASAPKVAEWEQIGADYLGIVL